MICHTVRISYTYGEVIKVKPIYDIHYGHKMCDIPELKKFISDEEAYYFGGGDWFDSVITKDKRYRKSMDNTKGDEIIDEQVDGLKVHISKIKSKLLGIMRGNHEKKVVLECGTNPAKRLSKELDVTYLGVSCFLQLILQEKASRGRVRTIVIKAHHGYGGGRTLGADLTRYAPVMVNYSADIYCFGHSHQKHWTPVERLSVTQTGKITHKPKHLCVCGSFQKTLSDNTDPAWAEEMGFPPVSLGGLTINIKPTVNSYDIWVER